MVRDVRALSRSQFAEEFGARMPGGEATHRIPDNFIGVAGKRLRRL